MLTDPKHGLTVLTRLAARRPEEQVRLRSALGGRLETLAIPALNVAIESGDPIGRVLADLFEQRSYDELSLSVEENLPVETTALRELALVLMRQRYDKYIHERIPQTREQVLYVVRTLAMYSHRLNAVGKLSAALNSLLGAMALLVPMEKDEETVPLMAEIFNNAAVIQSALGEHDDSLKAAETSITYHRWAVEMGRGDAIELADSLSTHAIVRMERSEFAEAVSLLEEALAILEQSVDGASVRGRMVRARLKNNLGVAQLHLNEPAKATSSLIEAVALIRRIAETNPDIYQFYLARYLGSLADARFTNGDLSEARKDVDESLLIFKGLSARRPDAFTDDYLKALHVKKKLAGSGNDAQSTAEILDRVVRERLEAPSMEPDRWKRWHNWALKEQMQSALARGDWKIMAALAGESASTVAAMRDPERNVELAGAHVARGIALGRDGLLDEAIAALEEGLAVLGEAKGERPADLRAGALRRTRLIFGRDRKDTSGGGYLLKSVQGIRRTEQFARTDGDRNLGRRRPRRSGR